MKQFTIGVFGDDKWCHLFLNKILNNKEINIRFICGRYKSKDKFNSKISMNLIIPIILLGLIGSLVFSNDGIPRRITNKLGMDNSMVTYEPDTKHMVSNKNIVIIGDSHAQQFGESLNISGFTNVKVFSKGTCFPFLGLNTLRQPTRLWKQGTDCQPWVDNAYTEIGGLVNTEIVIIACFYNQYLDGRIIINSDGKDDAHPVENFNNGINKTIEYLLSKNKKVVLALDVPELNGPCMPPRPFIFNSEKNCLIKKANESLQSNIYSNIIKNISDNNKIFICMIQEVPFAMRSIAMAKLMRFTFIILMVIILIKMD